MRERSAPAPTRPIPRRAPFTVDVVLFAPRGRQLMVLLSSAAPSHKKRRSMLPCDAPRNGESFEQTADRLMRAVARSDVAWYQQAGAFGHGKRHVVDAGLSVAFVGVVPAGIAARAGYVWHPANDLSGLVPRQRAMVEAALLLIRERLDYAPVAFRLLSSEFTLSELQQTYEMLLGRRLHKASFRRSLQAAWLVEPTDEWRTEGRGRPAQLFRYAPRRRRADRRGVRFDLLKQVHALRSKV
ncbi:MAG: NUDIX hydrolase [Gemmatimonadaceae bacterium]